MNEAEGTAQAIVVRRYGNDVDVVGQQDRIIPPRQRAHNLAEAGGDTAHSRFFEKRFSASVATLGDAADVPGRSKPLFGVAKWFLRASS